MDDCNGDPLEMAARVPIVQIPLWTIVTIQTGIPEGTIKRVQIPLWTIVTPHSRYFLKAVFIVQIPLWTIVTLPRSFGNSGDLGFRFLYGRL